MDGGKTQLRRATPSDWRRLGELLWRWDPLGVLPPRDEYDCLVAPLLRALEQGANRDSLADVLDRELRQRIGVSVARSAIEGFAAEVVRWFTSPSS